MKKINRAIKEINCLTAPADDRVQPSESVVNNHCPLHSQHLRYDAKVEQEARQLFRTVETFLLK